MYKLSRHYDTSNMILKIFRFVVIFNVLSMSPSYFIITNKVSSLNFAHYLSHPSKVTTDLNS